MLSILCVRLTIKVKVGIPESFKVGWYPPKKKTGSSDLKRNVQGSHSELWLPVVDRFTPKPSKHVKELHLIG